LRLRVLAVKHITMKKYFVHLRNEQQGPFTLDDLGPLGVERNTPVWYEGLPEWVAAVQVPEIREALFPVNPPPLDPDLLQPLEPRMAVDMEPPLTVIPLTPITHKHSSDIIIPGAETAELPDADARKRKFRLVLVAILVLVMGGMAAGYFMQYQQRSSPAGQQDTRAKDSLLRKESEGELREQLKAKEEQHPTEFLAGEISFRDNLIGQSVIRGHVTNSATAATFKDIELTITYISKTGAPISNEIFIVYEPLPPGQSASFKFKTRSPKGTSTSKMTVSGAKVGG
jgi:hypothetical protein